MKSIASSIVVLAGAYATVASAASLHVSGGLLQIIAFMAVLATLVLGLIGWWTCLKHDR